MIPLLHVLAVGHQDTRTCSGLRENLAHHSEIESKGVSKAQAFRERGRVHVHHHVHQRFDLPRSARLAHIPHGAAEEPQQRLCPIIGLWPPAAHQVQGPFAGLHNARSHARFQRRPTPRLHPTLHLPMHRRTHRGAVDKKFSGSPFQQAVWRLPENLKHRCVIAHHRDHHVSRCRYFRKCFWHQRPDFRSDAVGQSPVPVGHRHHLDSAVLQPAGHVGPHPPRAHHRNPQTCRQCI